MNKKTQRTIFLPALAGLLLVCFALSKFVFMIYNRDVESISFWNMLGVWLRGLPLDLRTTALALVIPALVSLQKHISWRKLLVPYYVILAIIIGCVTGADVVMYEFWKFKLNAAVISYAMSPEGATSSVSPVFLLTRVGCTLLYTIFLFIAFVRLTPKAKTLQTNNQSRLQLKSFKPIINLRPVVQQLAVFVVALLPINIGTCYRQGSSLMRNHSATNPAFAFITSFWASSTYNYMDPTEAQKVYKQLYTQNDGNDITDTLLVNNRPNILVVQLESFSGKFVKELGGLPDVTPQLSRLIPQGIWFSNYYSNSFRTDRGSVSLLTGRISHPTVSLMRETKYRKILASLPKTLKDNGYEADYLYAGPTTNMGKGQFVHDMQFDTLYEKSYFTAEELETAWGAHDGTAAYKMVEWLQNKNPEKPWFFMFQTLSSHEPWIVPYHRLKDEKLNAFAYTDDVVGQLVDTLRNSPLWDNLLMIILPDHGFLYEQTFEDPEFFHSPMLWLGGAVAKPRTVDVLMNQSDIAATLLAQMGIDHSQFKWSRNVFSKNYANPVVYCNFPAGIMLKDSTGVSIYDLTARKPITQHPNPSDKRIQQAKALLQHSYAELKQ